MWCRVNICLEPIELPVETFAMKRKIHKSVSFLYVNVLEYLVKSQLIERVLDVPQARLAKSSD